MKAACLFTDSMYALVVSNRGRTCKDVLDSGFTGAEETTRGDRIARVGSVGKDGVSKTFVETEAGVSGTIVGMGVGVGTSSCCALPAPMVLASDPRACLSSDSADSWLVLRVVGV